jgi:hypothetical protein
MKFITKSMKSCIIIIIIVLSFLQCSEDPTSVGTPQSYVKLLGASGSANQFLQTNDGGFLVSSYPSRIVHTDKYGNILWKRADCCLFQSGSFVGLYDWFYFIDQQDNIFIHLSVRRLNPTTGNAIHATGDIELPFDYTTSFGVLSGQENELIVWEVKDHTNSSFYIVNLLDNSIVLIDNISHVLNIVPGSDGNYQLFFWGSNEDGGPDITKVLIKTYGDTEEITESPSYDSYYIYGIQSIPAVGFVAIESIGYEGRNLALFDNNFTTKWRLPISDYFDIIFEALNDEIIVLKFDYSWNLELIVLDLNGNTILSSVLPIKGQPRFLRKTLDGGYALILATQNIVGRDGYSELLVKLDKNGRLSN